MRPPHSLLESKYFAFTSSKELVNAMGPYLLAGEAEEIERLSGLGLAPVTSLSALSTMIGINPGLTWSFINRPARHYRHFTIPKGHSVRQIDAPRVALKIVQKWLSIHLQRCYENPPHVHGFIPGKSHISAAKQHTSANWIFSVDISDFFPSTPSETVREALISVGYNEKSAGLLTSLFCFRGGLAQGSPASPVLSNIAFKNTDTKLIEIAASHKIRLTRYADDIVFSGTSDFPSQLPVDISTALSETPWRISQAKTEFSMSPERRKVHGLLVNDNTVRLTKGYRNKIRAYNHLLSKNKVKKDDLPRILGHVFYAKHIDSLSTDDT